LSTSSNPTYTPKPKYDGPALDFTTSSPLPPGVADTLDAVRLLAPAGRSRYGKGAPLVYVPGLDGSGEGVRMQVPALVAAGYDVRCLKVGIVSYGPADCLPIVYPVL
jgi:hypothetical protein